MTMHLAHPALNTTGHRKGKVKWASAEQKRRAEELEREWRAKTEEFRRMSKPVVFKPAPRSAEALRRQYTP